MHTTLGRQGHRAALGRTGQPGSTTLSSTNDPRCQSGMQEAAQLPRRPPVAAVLLPHLLHHGVHLCRRQVGVPHCDGLPPCHGAGCFTRVGGKHSRCIVLVAWWRWEGGEKGLELTIHPPKLAPRSNEPAPQCRGPAIALGPPPSSSFTSSYLAAGAPPKAYSTPYTSTPLWNTPKPHQYVQSFCKTPERYSGAVRPSLRRVQNLAGGALAAAADLLEKVIHIQVDGCPLPLSGVSKSRRAIDSPHWGAQTGAPASLAHGQLRSEARRTCADCWMFDMIGAVL